MDKVIYICGFCNKAVATLHWEDEITGLSHHACKKCEEESYRQDRLFWEQYGFEV